MKNLNLLRRLLFLLTASLIGVASGLLSVHSGFETARVYAQTGCTKGPSIPLSNWTDYNCESCVSFNGHRYLWTDVNGPLAGFCESPSNARYMQVEVETCQSWSISNPPPSGVLEVWDYFGGTILETKSLIWVGGNLFTSQTSMCYQECNWPTWYQVYFTASGTNVVCLDRIRYRAGCCNCDPSQC